MPIIAARMILRPRKQRCCDWCGYYIAGPQLRLYGMAEPSDPPSVMHLHRECTADPEVKRKLGEEELTHDSTTVGVGHAAAQ